MIVKEKGGGVGAGGGGGGGGENRGINFHCVYKLDAGTKDTNIADLI